MTAAPALECELAGSGLAEPFLRAAVGLHLWHKSRGSVVEFRMKTREAKDAKDANEAKET